MSITARYEKKSFEFKRPSGTSRGILTEKHAWFIYLKEDDFEGCGECSIIPGLSPDFIDFEQYENKIKEVVSNASFFIENLQELKNYPSILFGLEMAVANLKQGEKHIFFRSSFTQGKMHIPINGLIWMGKKEFMLQQIEDKLKQGYDCIKMKIGAIDFESELALLKSIREKFSPEEVELRVDANGAFKVEESKEKLKKLSQYAIHSIEQPIKAGQWNEMQKLCSDTPLDIALDEELIGIHQYEEKTKLLRKIKPQYIILKPSLHGGISGSKEWIEIAESLGINWWMTSALESNVGLSCIAQLTALFDTQMYQGLGTGQLYTNNIESRLEIEKGKIFMKVNE